ncbi:MAG: hypothetical protein HC941_31245 [Microcoleus sp. SU_5_3]|nr:hypothetical protein [Microcoleus sp. SU_5_3]
MPRSQRRWDGKAWIVDLHDPNQIPNEETNLEFIRRVCNECAARRNWKVYDSTAASSSQIESQKLDDIESALKAQIDAICEVLPKLPKGILKLVRWDSKKLRLQLTRFWMTKIYLMSCTAPAKRRLRFKRSAASMRSNPLDLHSTSKIIQGRSRLYSA